MFMVINFGETISAMQMLLKGMLTQITILIMTNTYFGMGHIGL